jgi:2-dehydropantoate 2-reductase
MNICIIGPGAIGTFLAVQLAPLARVTLVDRHAPRFSEQTVEVVGLRAGRAQVHVGPRVDGGADLIMVTTKANHLEGVSGLLGSSGAPVIFWQNGLGINQFARTQLQCMQVMRGLIWAGIMREAPYVVRCAGFSRIELGVVQGDVDPQELMTCLNLAGLETVIVGNIDCAEWEKALWNIGVNGLAAIAGEPNGVIINNPHLRTLLVALVREAQQVARCMGCELSGEDSVIRLTQSTATNLNSMLLDVRAGRTTEIEYLNGYVVQMGAKLGIEIPYNAAIYHLIKYIEARSLDDRVV